MNTSNVQMLLATANVYSGGIDGVAGQNTLHAVDLVLAGVGSGWSVDRRLVAAAQILLNDLGFEAGVVDGYAGHNTNNAFEQWLYQQVNGRRESVKRSQLQHQPKTTLDIPRQMDVAAFYGTPGAEITSQLTYVNLPFKLRLDWNLSEKITKLRVHRKCAPSLLAAMIEVHDLYGEERMAALGLDRYAGGHMHRKMRGGSKWSMHAYGCAVDFFAQPNGLRERCPKSLFCGDEYKPFLDIMENNGWLPAIRLWGADAMHFQMASL